MPRTAGALPATHGGDTEALHASASPAETGALKGGQRLCLLCRDTGQCRDAGLPPIQHCRDMGHYRGAGLPPIQHCTDMGHCQDTELPPIHHCRDSGHCPHCRNITHPSLQGHKALPRQGQSSTALPALPTQQHCQPRTARYEGTTHLALQGCRSPMHHPSCTACGALPSICTPRRKRGTAHACIRRTQTHCPPCTAEQTYPTGQIAEQRHCTAPAHCNGRHSISPLLHSH